MTSAPDRTDTAAALPEPLRSYLADASLSLLWTAVRARLERNSLQAAGTIEIELNSEGASRLGGLLGTHPNAGRQRIRLQALDQSLRTSAAQCSLLTAVSDLTGSPLIDRTAARRTRDAAWDEAWQHLDYGLAEAGLAGAAWVPAWLDGVRAAGLLTRAGPEAAIASARDTTRALGALHGTGIGPVSPATGPQMPARIWQLAELAAYSTGNAHGLDEGSLTSLLVLRAIAAATRTPPPESGADRRRLWERAGVASDLISGTVLLWRLLPPGDDQWSVMMQSRAALSQVTHLTLHELHSVPSVELIPAGTVVRICENPQILQAAAHHRVNATLVCTSGNPSAAGWELLSRLIQGGADVFYHGDFDWAGLAIARRVLERGALPWRMSTDDYLDALGHASAANLPPLVGPPVPTPWDDNLATAMGQHNIAVHEEAVLPQLLTDLRST